MPWTMRLSERSDVKPLVALKPPRRSRGWPSGRSTQFGAQPLGAAGAGPQLGRTRLKQLNTLGAAATRLLRPAPPGGGFPSLARHSRYSPLNADGPRRHWCNPNLKRLLRGILIGLEPFANRRARTRLSTSSFVIAPNYVRRSKARAVGPFTWAELY